MYLQNYFPLGVGVSLPCVNAVGQRSKFFTYITEFKDAWSVASIPLYGCVVLHVGVIIRCVNFIIIIIIIILGISFMQGIHTYILETNHVPREQCVATILM